MSSFTRAVVEIDDSVNPCLFKLFSDMQYHCGSYPSEEVYVVPAGYETDLASIPRFLWGILPPHGNYSKPAILHDYLYTFAIGTKKKADKVFYEAMGVCGVNKFTRIFLYIGVRIFGKGSYK